MSMRDLYNFTKIRDARNVSRSKVNIIGVVLEHGFPRLSKGTGKFSCFSNNVLALDASFSHFLL